MDNTWWCTYFILCITQCIHTHRPTWTHTYIHTSTYTHRNRERRTHTIKHARVRCCSLKPMSHYFLFFFNTPSSNRLKSKRVCVTWTRGCLFLIISTGNLKVLWAVLSVIDWIISMMSSRIFSISKTRGRWAGLQVQVPGSAHVGWCLVLKVLGIWCKYCGKEQSRDLTGHFFTLLITSSWCVWVQRSYI